MSLLDVSLVPTRRTALPIAVAATRRSTRVVLRSPALLVAPIAQSLFFLLIYSGQLSTVGSGYLAGGSFISFLLPLILLTGVATAAGTAGTLVLRDVSSGYLDRLRLAHGTATPFLMGAVIAALVAVIIGMFTTIVGAVLIGYRPQSWAGAAAVIVLMLVLGLGIALLSVAVAIRSGSATSTNLVTLAVFGLSFFTGVFAPVDELAGWMRVIATVNPLTHVVDTARQLESGATLSAAPIALAALSALVVAGVAACVLAVNHARRNR
ncbi:ABC transporter permease [Micromonospora sp. NRRL B-16802]|uniref:ABC transporter permease n=1 Tax=Micromonospora sp. NRRL B-16802 TaxID=1415541 RepID=UPI0006B03B04|nr:ABC transporter permease [Micromonospora sp. NRRL B-16802]